jgi:hypothetical protein
MKFWIITAGSENRATIRNGGSAIELASGLAE